MTSLSISLAIGSITGGGGAEPFSPGNVSVATPRSWHAADDDDATLVTGPGVASWLDKFGNGYDLSEPTATPAKRPTLTTLSGRQALSFAAASVQLLSLTSAPLVNALAGGVDTPFTAYIILSSADDAGNTCPFSLSSSLNNVTYSLVYKAGTTLRSERRDGVGATTNAAFTGALTAASGANLLRLRFSGTDMVMILNGVTLTTATSNNVGSMALDRFSVGAHTDFSLPSGALPLNGKIGEIATYTGLVPEAEEARLVAEHFAPRWPGVS